MNEKQFRQFIKDYKYLIKEQILSVDEALGQINQTIKENIDLNDFTYTQEEILELLGKQSAVQQSIADKMEDSQEDFSIRFQSTMDKLAVPLRAFGKMRAIGDLQAMGDLRQFIAADVSEVIGQDRKLIDLGLIIKDGFMDMTSGVMGIFGRERYDDEDVYEMLDDINGNIEGGFNKSHAMTIDVADIQNKLLSEMNVNIADSYALQQEAYLRQLREGAEQTKGFAWWQRLGLGILVGVILGGYLAKVLYPLEVAVMKMFKFSITEFLSKGFAHFVRTVISGLIKFFATFAPIIVWIYDSILVLITKISKWLGITNLFEQIGLVIGRKIGELFQIPSIKKSSGAIINLFRGIIVALRDMFTWIMRQNRWLNAIGELFIDTWKDLGILFQKILATNWKLTMLWDASYSAAVDFVRNIQKMFATFSGFLSKSTNPLMKTLKVIFNLISEIGILRGLFAPIMSGITWGFKIGMKLLGKAFFWLFAFFDFFIGFFKSDAKDMLGKLTDGFMSALRGFINPLLDLIGYILYYPFKWLGVNIFSALIDPLKGFLEQIYYLIAKPMAITLALVDAISSTFWKFIKILWNIVTFDFAEAGEVFRSIGTMWKNLIVSFYTYLGELAVSLFDWWSWMGKAAKAFNQWSKDLLVKVWSKFVGFVVGIPVMILDYFVKLRQSVIDTFFGVVKYIEELPLRLISWIQGINERTILFFKRTWAGIVAFITGLAEKIWTWLENAVRIDPGAGGGMDMVKRVLKTLFDFFYTFARQSIEVIWKFAKFSLTTIPKLMWFALTKAMPAMLGWFTYAVWELAKALIQLPWFIIKGLAKAGWYLLTHLDDIGKWIIMEGVPMIFKIMLKLLVTLGQALLNIILAVIGFIAAIPVTIATAILAGVQAILHTIATIPDRVTETINEWSTFIVGKFTAMFMYLSELPAKIMDSITGLVKKVPGASWLGNLFGGGEEEVQGMQFGGMPLKDGLAFLHANEIVGPAKEIIPQIINEVTGGNMAGEYSRNIDKESARATAEQLLGVRQVRDVINTTKQTIESTSKENNEERARHMNSFTRDRQEARPIEPPADIEALGVLFFNKTWGVS